MIDANVCVTRDMVVAQARTWLGVKWRHQGRDRSGIDCGGLVVRVGQELGLMNSNSDYSGYSRLPTLNELIDACAERLKRKTGPAFRDRRPGDVVVLRPNENYRWPSHIGILTRLPSGELGMIHSYNAVKKKGGDVVLETHYAPWWNCTVAVLTYHGMVEDE